MPTDCNASLSRDQGDKLEIRFPSDGGFLRVGRHAFKDRDDLVKYLESVFPLEKHGAGYRSTIKRKGKYVRVDGAGRTIFTFGDPILDVITDENGWLALGAQRLNLRRSELTEPGLRGGGIRSMDLSPRAGELDRMLSRAALGEGDFTIVEARADAATLASKNPAALYFYSGTAKMRFRAFKKNYVVGWKMGADIETWGADFARAEIRSEYGVHTAGLACAIVKRDSDEDTNDDYVDEYEWGIGSDAPDGINAICWADWRGSIYTGQVSKGDCQLWV
jgi:hypothetical protein